jgi:S1-C subfamily serine protease
MDLAPHLPLPLLTRLAGALVLGLACATLAPRAEAEDADPAVRALQEAAGAVVAVRTRALGNARSNASLGAERTGSGVLIAPSGLVLTIGYLVLEADQVEVTDASGRSLPAVVVAYDHATGFGLLRPMGPLAAKPARLGASGAVEQLDRVLVATGGEGGASVATVVSRRPFAGYWEYLIDGAIFMIGTGRQKGGRRPWVGVNAVEDDGRLKVLRVTEEGPADRAGLQAGDIILAVAGAKVKKLDDFYRKLWSAGEPGVEVPFTVLQGNEVRELKLRSIDRLDFVRRKPAI